MDGEEGGGGLVFGCAGDESVSETKRTPIKLIEQSVIRHRRRLNFFTDLPMTALIFHTERPSMPSNLLMIIVKRPLVLARTVLLPTLV